MKVFKVEHIKKFQTIKVTLHNPPYENENILHKTSWKAKDCVITELYTNVDSDKHLKEPSRIDYEDTHDKG